MFIDFEDRDFIGYVPIDKMIKGQFAILIDDEEEDCEEQEAIDGFEW